MFSPSHLEITKLIFGLKFLTSGKGERYKNQSGRDYRRNQEQRLAELETRIKKRKKELEKQKQVISLAPDIEAYCLALPV